MQLGPHRAGQRAQRALQERRLRDDVVGGARRDVRDREHDRVVGVDPPGERRLQRPDHRRGRGHRVERVVRGRGVPAAAGHRDRAARRPRPSAARAGSCSSPVGTRRGDVQRVRGVGRPAGRCASSSPSSIMYRAPWKPSSPGWNMNSTRPASSSRSVGEHAGGGGEHRHVRVVPAGVHRPGDLGGELAARCPRCSGRASMSPRSSTVGPGRRPVQHGDDRRHRPARGAPAAAGRRARRRTASRVSGQVQARAPGCRCSARRSATVRGCTVRACARSPARRASSRGTARAWHSERS